MRDRFPVETADPSAAHSRFLPYVCPTCGATYWHEPGEVQTEPYPECCRAAFGDGTASAWWKAFWRQGVLAGRKQLGDDLREVDRL